MTSLTSKFSRYTLGGTSEVANNKIEWWEKKSIRADSTDIIYTVENFYQGRLDLIANTFYSEPRYWWIIAQINNILDPVNEITPGRVLRIPTKERINSLVGAKLGGVESKRQPVTTVSPIIS